MDTTFHSLFPRSTTSRTDAALAFYTALSKWNYNPSENKDKSLC